MKQPIARATGALIMGLLVLVPIGFILGWGVAFIGLAMLSLYLLTTLHVESK